VDRLPVFVQSGDLEVQERVSVCRTCVVCLLCVPLSFDIRVCVCIALNGVIMLLLRLVVSYN